MLFLDAARDKAPGKRTKSKVEVTRSIIFAEWQTETKDLRTGKCEKTIPSHHVLLPRPRVSRRPPSVQDWEECQLQSLCSLSRAAFFSHRPTPRRIVPNDFLAVTTLLTVLSKARLTRILVSDRLEP